MATHVRIKTMFRWF